jgi:hypothetical protein
VYRIEKRKRSVVKDVTRPSPHALIGAVDVCHIYVCGIEYPKPIRSVFLQQLEKSPELEKSSAGFVVHTAPQLTLEGLVF